MTPVEALAVVRARLESMVALAEAATPGPWDAERDSKDNWHLVGRAGGLMSTLGWGEQAADDTLFLAAVSPDLLIRVAREALSVLDRHSPYSSDPECCSGCEEDNRPIRWPCLEVKSVLRAWQP